ncbi:NAD(P)/FAD-dependent oxidoreductase [Corynebacterium sanguinis]|uniref:flavin-containing monooxygenase n=1 Tax=Corynebacterium sanguinis TaxID=2594913 RepID=UPI00223C4A55|nr:NAD(P)/FAD-dependent oxidoreductase [Corynebacterium sanguinis]MCT1554794.1 NAD(P)/FAD-dependent oxidoreductase [Corynebacterium sanguinis]MCT1614399.1 NAD(P)/FAD-dependent oxidoreductase [Corynebacterium sanguinis]
MSDYDALVLGGGQSGLAAAHALRREHLRTAVLEASDEPVGSWPHYYDSLTLFSPAKYSALPGLPFPGDPDRYPQRDEVVDYLRRYAKTLDVDIHVNQRVETVTHGGHLYTAATDTGETFTAPRIIAATGGFGSPHIPTLPGQDRFTGTIIHASTYRTPADHTGDDVIVVGAGNSAVQIAVELADTARVTLAARTAPKFVPQRPLGRDMHFWFTVTGLDTLPIGHLLHRPPTAPVFDTGRYRTALATGKPQARQMFTGLDGDTAHWPDGTTTEVNTIILATGYTPHLPYLADLGALTDTGHPRHRNGLSTTHPGLGYIGLEWQRSLSSASLRGVGKDARYVARHISPTEPRH